VHYSVFDDGDDVVAALAHHWDGDVLSRDQDFYRYQGANYRIFDDYRIQK
jgi:hypothetical protein